jgi:poly-gamma-glutamate capsule biosynthesis protein CapA/YwtB (metallophosphatase superfamily)
MNDWRRHQASTALASVVAWAAFLANPVAAWDPRGPLPIYIEDNHAGAFQFLATTLDLDAPHVLVLIDAHSDDTAPRDGESLRVGMRRVATAEERAHRVEGWRREGRVQAFDWIRGLMPAPLSKVVWVREGPGAPDGETLPPGFERSSPEELERHLIPGLPVVVSIDLDAFTEPEPRLQAAHFARLWGRVVRLPRLAAVSFAISRPWLADDAEASRLLTLALEASLALPHAEIRFEPWGIEGPDRSERAKEFYRQRREPPRFDPETAPPELRSLLLANAARLDVGLAPERWRDLLGRWRAEQGEWRIVLEGVDAGADGILRPASTSSPDLHIEGGLPGRVRSVTWLQWAPAVWSHDVLPELPAGKVFAGAAPPVVAYESRVLARTTSLSLGPAEWRRALPGPEETGVLRLSAELETDAGVERTARIEIRRGAGDGFRAGLSEQFGLPYVFGAGFLRRAGLTGPDTGVGNDCANFLVSAWRRSGLRMPWSNPAQLRRHLVKVGEQVGANDKVSIPPDAGTRGLVVHLGSHVAALWEDRAPVGTLGPEDLVIHHLGGAPEVISLARLLEGRDRKRFDLYLGPLREAASGVAVGGDMMPGTGGAPPAGLRDMLGRTDLAVANLETTVGSGGRPVEKRYVFQVPPSRLGDLRAAGISSVSLANNHAGDFGEAGLRATLAALDADGIGHFGAGLDTSAAVAPWITKVGASEVAFISVSLTDLGLLSAGPGRAGVAVLPGHEEEVAEAIAHAHRRGQTVVVLPHWGTEGTARITEEQRSWARWFVAQGADAVVGSGPHVVQAYETVGGVPVFYSVGNLWFDGQWPAESREAGVAFLGLDRDGRVVAARMERLSTVVSVLPPRPSP